MKTIIAAVLTVLVVIGVAYVVVGPQKLLEASRDISAKVTSDLPQRHSAWSPPPDSDEHAADEKAIDTAISGAQVVAIVFAEPSSAPSGPLCFSHKIARYGLVFLEHQSPSQSDIVKMPGTGDQISVLQAILGAPPSSSGGLACWPLPAKVDVASHLSPEAYLAAPFEEYSSGNQALSLPAGRLIVRSIDFVNQFNSMFGTMRSYHATFSTDLIDREFTVTCLLSLNQVENSWGLVGCTKYQS
ncbi:MAG: hypothetical protein KGJ78_03020 [Alphaproteobacteria bacterium]|nr:hypothetical protein [Alphaproteobacteria bacterium]